jgi:hypothetical protein
MKINVKIVCSIVRDLQINSMLQFFVKISSFKALCVELKTNDNADEQKLHQYAHNGHFTDLLLIKYCINQNNF